MSIRDVFRMLKIYGKPFCEYRLKRILADLCHVWLGFTHIFIYIGYKRLGEYCPDMEFFLVRFSHDWTKYRFRPSTEKYGTENTLYLDIFHAVSAYIKTA